VKSKVIMFDLDGVLSDFTLHFSTHAARYCNLVPWSNLEQFTMDYTSPENPAYRRIPVEVKDKVWSELLSDPHWWDQIPPSTEEKDFQRINRLNETGQTIIFCTYRFGTHALKQSNAWLRKHGIEHPNVVLSKRKGDVARSLDADYFIEDKAENAACIKWFTDDTVNPCKVYIIDRAYNRAPFLPEKIKRIKTVAEYLNDIEEDLNG
jgi:hypothetical protein